MSTPPEDYNTTNETYGNFYEKPGNENFYSFYPLKNFQKFNFGMEEPKILQVPKPDEQ